MARCRHRSQDLHRIDQLSVQKDAELERITMRHVTSRHDCVREDIMDIPPGRTPGEQRLAGNPPPSQFTGYK
ncbi:hypothetical protein Hdeb2414_s0648g00929411 [Helianthus debilis subsp. tardiflorus]